MVGARSADLRPHAASWGWWCWTKSTKLRSNRRQRRAIMPATWPLPAPRPSRFRWCWAPPRRRWRVGSGPRRAVHAGFAAPAGCSTGRCRWSPRSTSQRVSRSPQPRGISRPCTWPWTRPARRRASDPAAQPPRFLHPHPVPLLRLRGALPGMLHRADAPRERQIALCHYCDFQMPAAGALSRSAGFRAFATADWAPSGWRPRCGPAFPSIACLRMDTDTMQKPGSHQQALDRVSCRRGADSARARR